MGQRISAFEQGPPKEVEECFDCSMIPGLEREYASLVNAEREEKERLEGAYDKLREIERVVAEKTCCHAAAPPLDPEWVVYYHHIPPKESMLIDLYGNDTGKILEHKKICTNLRLECRAAQRHVDLIRESFDEGRKTYIAEIGRKLDIAYEKCPVE